MGRWIGVVAAILTTTMGYAGPEERVEARQLLMEYVAERGGLEQALANPLIDIRERTLVCVACHGDDGNSVRADIPSIAEQNPAYFIEQMLIFQREGRYPEMMHGFAEQFAAAEIVALALHYAQLPRTVKIPVDRQLGAQGEALYQNHCASCHGARGEGVGEVFAAIHKQRPDYLVRTMQRYRTGDIQRRSHEMEEIIGDWPEQTIRQLAHYIAGLPGKARE